MVTIAVTAEPEFEPRVAASPDTVKKLVATGCKVRIETGAGLRSRFPDEAFAAQGAEIANSRDAALSGAEVLLAVRRPSAEDIAKLKPGAVVAAMLDPFGDKAELEALAATRAMLFSMEFMPRTTRAQSMDVLSSQANLAGYKGVIEGVSTFGAVVPMMTTPAGTVPAAKIFIMGVGVAGLQAIATARRLGGIVTATDVRPATKEQVQSLGAKFIAVENEEFQQAQTAGGYAKEMSDDYKRQQAELVANHVKAQDIVVTTALIPGRPAPKLITADMVSTMKPGAVIVDLAAERGGNCALTKSGETVVTDNGVTIVGTLNLAGSVPVNASSLYARNLLSFLQLMIDKDGVLTVNEDDDIIKGTLVAKDGALVHPNLTQSAA